LSPRKKPGEVLLRRKNGTTPFEKGMAGKGAIRIVLVVLLR